MEDAIVREKQLKEWHRAWKIKLIEQTNPDRHDLWSEVCGVTGDASEGDGWILEGLSQKYCQTTKRHCFSVF